MFVRRRTGGIDHPNMQRPTRGIVCLLAIAIGAEVPSVSAQQQIVDLDFKVSVDRPAYRADGPTVAIDEAHSNFHTASGQYKPFADLLTADGYRVVASTRKFATGVLDGIGVLVVANANAQNFTDAVFTEAECDMVRDWVRAGGSLLPDRRPRAVRHVGSESSRPIRHLDGKGLGIRADAARRDDPAHVLARERTPRCASDSSRA